MMETQLCFLKSDGTYRLTQAQPEPEWPNYLRIHKNRQAISLDHKPVFTQNKPIYFPTIEALKKAEAPPPELNPKRNMVIVEEGTVDPYAVRYPGVRTRQSSERRKQLQEVWKTSFQYARESATRGDSEQKYQKAGFLLLVGATVFMIMVMGLIAMGSYASTALGGEEIGNTESEISAAAEPGETPVPVPALSQ
tara:strand:- start:1999 stop:2580 length:582 start_codon:yes stop_codon:yes gene_type:complete